MTAQRIHAITQTCIEHRQQADWYCQSLGFVLEREDQLSGGWLSRLLGIPESWQLHRSLLRLGKEQLELWEWKHHDGASVEVVEIPTDSRSTDLWFQHICVVTTDIHQAYPHARAVGGDPISQAIQTLPEWNVGAAGIQAVKFADPLGHALELLQFPEDKGDRRWHRDRASKIDTTSGNIGMDHSAIGISDTAQSIRFYTELLGFTLAGGGWNYGIEQDRLDGVSEARVQITSLRPQQGGLGIEFLNYQDPKNGRQREHAACNDLCEWRIIVEVSDIDGHHQMIKRSAWASDCRDIEDLDGQLCGLSRGFHARDPDGHALLIVSN